MQKSFITLALALLLTGTAGMAYAGDIDPGLEKVMESMTADQEISVLVYLNDQANLAAITDQMDSQNATLRYRHEIVVRSLQEVASNTQAELINQLDNLQEEGKVLSYENFWVTNAFRVETTADMVKTIADHPSVSTVYFNYEIELIEPTEVKPSSGSDIANVEVGVQAVNADDVWAMGFDGSGVLVANMDTGVEGDHPALEDTWAGVADPRYQGHPEWAWYDPYNNQNDFPYDNHGHGTHTIGSVCGRDTNTGDTIGCAPGAYWIASAPIDRGGGIPRTVADAILSFQWMVDPDGNPSTNWDVPDVCSNSWGVTTGHGYPPCDTLFWSYLDACEAAGTVILFSAGNEGSSGLRRPSDRATDDYRTCAVAAVDANQSGWPIASFSSRGPTYCTPDGSAAIKPDIAAPGVDVRSAYPGGGYTTMSGTSMASPHVNGVVALIRDANPNLSVELIKQIIYDTAYDLGPTGEDNSYGWGMIDAYQAVQLALSYLDGYGVIAGQVTDQVSGDGLPGTVTVTNREPEIVASCNQQGYYTLYVPADSVWELRAEYTSDYLPDFASVSVTENDTVTQNFVLEPKVEVILSASFGNPEDLEYRTFFVRGSWDDDGFYNAGWIGDFIAIHDDGIAPDQTANDGVYTGSVMLATDLNNTYEWGVYSENYNEHASFLQFGSSFDVTDPGTPPTVPTLAVNPSGSENNWTITASEVNSGLEFDLMPGYNGQDEIWYGTVYIPGGITGQYIIKVMHSDMASYGQGGVGGMPITFTTTYSGNYTFYFNDGNDLASTGAQLTIQPSWLEVDVQVGDIVTRDINLINDGELPLYFGIAEEVDDYLSNGSSPELPDVGPVTSFEYTGPKPHLQETPGTPTIYGQGGPDNYGYTWIDSDEPGGPDYSWVDITSVGTPLNMSDDDNEGPFALPFNFNFYGTDFNSFRVCSNGWISFTSSSTQYYNYPIPSTDAPENFVGPMWDDFNPYSGGEVYYYVTNDSAVVSWVDVPHYYDTGSYTFQVVLLRSGAIYFNYQDLDGDVNSATVGIQNANRNDGLQMVYNASYLHDNLTVKLNAGWLDADPTSGTVSAGGQTPVTVTLDASNLTTGDYTGRLIVNSWDDIRQLPDIEVPVTLHVMDALPDLSLAMMPDESPVEVYPGGTFDYTIMLTNNTGSTYNFDAWLMVELPDNSMYGPLMNVPAFIGADQTIYYYGTQWVPTIAPAGSYGYHSYVGNYPNAIDHATFPFTVVTGSVANTGIDDWKVDGAFGGGLVREGGDALPMEYSLSQSYPNPFNANTTIEFALPQAGHVDLTVYNLMGQVVETLIDANRQAGYHSVNWNASNYSSGIYFYKLSAGDKTFTKRMTLLK